MSFAFDARNEDYARWHCDSPDRMGRDDLLTHRRLNDALGWHDARPLTRLRLYTDEERRGTVPVTRHAHASVAASRQWGDS